VYTDAAGWQHKRKRSEGGKIKKIWTRRILKEDSKKNPSDPRAEEGATEFRPEQVELGFFFGCGLQWRRRRRRVVIVRCALLCSVHG
jgi:hypothetical protein